MTSLINGSDGRPRCGWSQSAPEFFDYHESEWGFPEADNSRLFEKLCLEAFQSGLSWRTILAKRENFRAAFKGFDIGKVARFNEKDVGRLLNDSGIVRHRGKIEAVINNAERARELVKQEGALAAFFWRYAAKIDHHSDSPKLSPSAEAVALSKDLKKRGWKFIGPTTAYAFMQAAGLINDHTEGCIVREKVAHERRHFLTSTASYGM